MPEEGIRATVIEPDGRTVVLTEEAWSHILEGHPELAPYEQAVKETITHPINRVPDVRPGRERYVSENIGPSRFLTVVVAFDDEQGEIVTAFGHRSAR